MSCEKRLKQMLADFAHTAGVPFGRFRAQFGLDDFLENVLLPTDDALVAAAKALNYFCIEDGRFNRCLFALKAILAFLEEEASDQPRDEAALIASQKDLKAVMTGECTVESLIKWVQRWYRI